MLRHCQIPRSRKVTADICAAEILREVTDFWQSVDKLICCVIRSLIQSSNPQWLETVLIG